jgi:hypothetical protein
MVASQSRTSTHGYCSPSTIEAVLTYTMGPAAIQCQTSRPPSTKMLWRAILPWSVTLLSSAFPIVARAITCDKIQLYVAVDADRTEGLLSNGSSPAKAFANVQDAADHVKYLLAQSSNSTNKQVVVNVGPGTYHMETYLFLTNEHSGTTDCPTVWQAPQGGAVMSGGRRVRNWSPTSGMPGVYQANVPRLSYARALYVDDVSMPRARSINIPQNNSVWSGEGYSYNGTALNFADISKPNQTELRFIGTWTDRYCPTDYLSPDGETLIMKQPCWYRQFLGYDTIGENFRQDEGIFINQLAFFIENSLTFLTTPGFWYLDTETDILYYMPVDGKDPNTSKIILPKLEVLLSVGGYGYDFPAHDIHFYNLSWAHTTWNFPGSEYGYVE